MLLFCSNFKTIGNNDTFKRKQKCLLIQSSNRNKQQQQQIIYSIGRDKSVMGEYKSSAKIVLKN